MTTEDLLFIYAKSVEAQMFLESKEYHEALSSLQETAKWIFSKEDESGYSGKLEILLMGLDSSLKLLYYYDSNSLEFPDEVLAFITSELESLQVSLTYLLKPSEGFSYSECFPYKVSLN